MKYLLPWLPLPFAVLATGALGAVLGHASSTVFVIGLVALTLGLTAGAVVSVVSLLGGDMMLRRALVCASVGVVAGWGAFQVAEDEAFSAHWRMDYAAAQQAAAGVDPAEALAGDESVFFALGADEALERQVSDSVGLGGVWGRWLFRADAGIRLLGPANGGRGLDVGRYGALLWALIEIGIAFLVARRLLQRVREVLEVQSRAERALQES